MWPWRSFCCIGKLSTTFLSRFSKTYLFANAAERVRSMRGCYFKTKKQPRNISRITVHKTVYPICTKGWMWGAEILGLHRNTVILQFYGLREGGGGHFATMTKARKLKMSLEPWSNSQVFVHDHCQNPNFSWST